MPNIENINKVIDALRKDQEVGTHFIMRDFAQYIDENTVPGEESGSYQLCNTALCIAGWANLLRMQEQDPDALKSADFISNAGSSRGAREWLGIPYEQADPLFAMSNARIGVSTFDRLVQDVRYKAGIRVLEILRDEGVVDWDRALSEAGYNPQ